MSEIPLRRSQGLASIEQDRIVCQLLASAEDEQEDMGIEHDDDYEYHQMLKPISFSNAMTV